MSDREKETMNRIKVKFTGDFVLPTNPVTFEDAIQVGIHKTSYAKFIRFL